MEKDILKFGDLIYLHGSIPFAIQSPIHRSKRQMSQGFNHAGFLSAIG